MKSEQLFKQRKAASWAKAIRIIQLIIGGGGTPIVVGAMIIFLSIAYARLIKWIPPETPLPLILAILLSLPLTFSFLRTWIQSADLTFLLPMEPHLQGYFRQSLLYSMQVHLFRLAVILLILFPLYQQRLGDSQQFWLIFVLLCLLQIYNTYLGWLEDRLTSVQSKSRIYMWAVFRWLVNVWVSYFLLSKLEWIDLLTLLVPLAHLLYFRSITPAYPYPWVLWKEREQKTIANYYALAGWFVDLREHRYTVKERRWITWIMEKIARRQTAYSYLFWRIFFRQGDFFATYLRILLWGLMILLFIPHLGVLAAVDLLSIWLLISQLPQMTRIERYPVLFRLYPLLPQERNRSFSYLCLGLLSFLCLFLTLVAWIVGLPLSQALLIQLGSLIISYLVSFFYLPKQLNKES
jgi:ABC-2 type transport system permease protein